jgi:hypothetical protein
MSKKQLTDLLGGALVMALALAVTIVGLALAARWS